MRFAVVVFPGSNCDKDCVRALRDVMGQDVAEVWHTETSLSGFDAVVLPGGFSYGDYLRCGAIARFSKIMRAVKEHADRGGLVLGICNGFQILVEAHLLPGALIRNRSLKFMCRPVWLKRERRDSLFTARGEDFLRLPIAHGEGQYFIDAEGYRKLEDEGRIAYRYEAPPGIEQAENPNGSVGRIAGILNAKGNILGMMPHPERACEEFTGGVTHGRWIFESMIAHLTGERAARAGIAA
ncbi:MAG: phosphoribosylformylglycinamidine synthase subunit PurQ [Candidatus Hydrogenedentota bacterium]